MKITKITPAVKTQARYNVFVDEEFAFSVTEEQLLNLALQKGQEISPEKLTELMCESDFGKNYARALDLILRRPRSQKEIHDYAWRKRWTPENRDRVVAKLHERGYLNDEKFAELFVRSRAHLKNLSRRQMEQQLIKKGIKPEIIAKTLKNSQEYNELQALQNLIIKKQGKYADPQKFLQYLARQGFSYDDIKSELARLEVAPPKD